MQAKVVVVGGSGAAGKIHIENCKKLGAIVASFDITKNPDADQNYDAKTTLHS
jgi:glutamate dehydrogenase/leucine dehydrogenase